MECPACCNKLSSLTAGAVKVEACANGCGGVWFDQRELENFDEEAELEGKKIMSVPRAAAIKAKPLPRKCPCCASEVLVRQYFDPSSKMELDVCWSCGGVWLDAGELATIRGEFKTAADRQKAGDTFVKEVLTQHESAVKHATKEQIAKYQAQYKNRLTALFSSFGGLLDPAGDGYLK